MLRSNMFVHGAFCALCTVILFPNVNVAEWVDMPQFSDETKVYRIPSVQHDQFYKFRRRGDADSIIFTGDQRNGSQAYRHPAKTTYVVHNKRMEIKKTNSVSVSTTPANLFPDQIADSFADIGTSHTATITDVVPAVTNKLNNNKDDAISPTKDTMINTLTTPSSSSIKEETSQDKYNNDTVKQDDSIFQYLPIDVLKSVHRTLQSQPASVEGKLYFLKTFERTLMSEIESRLTTTMTPSRKIRGVDYYGHDDHDDHSVGFPSIEGTLMAISFLTFAVYLVRLVMLLLRNINMPTTTTTAATVFLGKRKRSIDLDDDTARILSNINSFVPDI